MLYDVSRRIGAAILILAGLLFLAFVAQGSEPQFVVRNRMTEFRVTNRCPAVAETETVARRFLAFRRPVGHTHTCSNGHTWDHQANPTHRCQFCGASQYVVDPTPRMVTVQKVVQVPVVVQPPVVRKVVEPVQKYDHVINVLPTYSFLGVSAGGCANGQCSTIQAPTKFRLFR